MRPTAYIETSVNLAHSLVDLGAVPGRAADDAAHIAIAATNGVDFIALAMMLPTFSVVSGRGGPNSNIE